MQIRSLQAYSSSLFIIRHFILPIRMVTMAQKADQKIFQ
jgi:hypothetical protein